MPRRRSPLTPALVAFVALAPFAALACSEPPPPRPLSSFGQPLPTASTTAEPLWLRSGGTSTASSRPAEP